MLKLVFAAGMILLSGCASQIQPHKIQDLGTEHVLDKNYSIGKQQDVFVGEALLRVKDYYLTTYSSQVVSPSSNFNFDGGISHLKGEKGSFLTIIGNKVVDGVNYRVVQLNDPDVPNAHLLIDNSGKAHNKILSELAPPNSGFVTVLYDHIMTPDNVRFVSETKKEVSLNDGFINYELIYNGRDENSFHITYREFSPDNLARASFFQTLTYSTSSDTIRFKENQIQVHSVDNEKIVYTVMKDAYK